MLDDPASVVEAEDVDAGPILIVGPLLVAVEHDEVPLRDPALEANLLYEEIDPDRRPFLVTAVLDDPAEDHRFGR